MRRRTLKSRTVAPAIIIFTKANNEKGENQLCVYGECMYGGRMHGPIWSHSVAAVKRCLCELTRLCDCGRKYHKHRRSEGQRVLPKEK